TRDASAKRATTPACWPAAESTPSCTSCRISRGKRLDLPVSGLRGRRASRRGRRRGPGRGISAGNPKKAKRAKKRKSGRIFAAGLGFTAVFLYICPPSVFVEGCPSGLRYMLGKHVWSHIQRGFESPSLCHF